MEMYCSNCGFAIIDSLYCEDCGAIAQNIPTKFSAEESLAGLVVATLTKNTTSTIKFSELFKLDQNKERLFRVFAQLERTNNYIIEKTENDFILHKRKNLERKINKKLKKLLLEALPLEETDLSEK